MHASAVTAHRDVAISARQAERVGCDCQTFTSARIALLASRAGHVISNALIDNRARLVSQVVATRIPANTATLVAHTHSRRSGRALRLAVGVGRVASDAIHGAVARAIALARLLSANVARCASESAVRVRAAAGYRYVLFAIARAVAEIFRARIFSSATRRTVFCKGFVTNSFVAGSRQTRFVASRCRKHTVHAARVRYVGRIFALLVWWLDHSIATH